MTASNCPCRGCPRNCKRRILRHHATGLSGPGKATKGGDPRARRPAVSSGHARACRSGSTDSSRTNRPYGTAGETSFAVTHHCCATRGVFYASRCVCCVAARRCRACCAVCIVAVVRCRSDPAHAQDGDQSTEVLPAIDVISTRIGTRSSSGSGGSRTSSTEQPAAATASPARARGEPVVGGIAGASTTIITSAEIERAPQSTLQDILSREAGIQTNSLYGGVNGTGTAVDMRGFGVTAPSNTLVLVDGRRFNDSDIAGFRFQPDSAQQHRPHRDHPRQQRRRALRRRRGRRRHQYRDQERRRREAECADRGQPSARSTPARAKVSVQRLLQWAWSAAAFGNAFRSDGYRANNKTRQNQAVGDFRYTTNEGSVFFNISGDDLRQRLPGPRNILNGRSSVSSTNTSPTGAEPTRRSTIRNRQNMAMRGGVTRKLWNGAELTVDGSFRQKHTQWRLLRAVNTLFVVPNDPVAIRRQRIDHGVDYAAAQHRPDLRCRSACG